MSNDFIKESTNILNKIGVIDLKYSRIDGKPIFKIYLDKINLLKKYFKIILISPLEDYVKYKNTSTYIYEQSEILLKITDYSNTYLRKIKIDKINEQNIYNK